jgi:hypothetical protein
MLGAEFGQLHKQVSGLRNGNRGHGNDGNKMAHALQSGTATTLMCEFFNII